jgi:acetyl-CoA carboxylase carboxyl transferase subunit alpha
MLKFKLIDGIVKEPLGGAHSDREAMYKKLKKVILDEIKSLSAVDAEQRILDRIDKFSAMGVVVENA